MQGSSSPWKDPNHLARILVITLQRSSSPCNKDPHHHATKIIASPCKKDHRITLQESKDPHCLFNEGSYNLMSTSSNTSNLTSILFILIVRFARRFVNAVVLYGLTMTSVDVSPDPYLGFILSSVVEFPADVITFLLLHKVGRRIPYSGFFLAGGAVCIVAAFLTEGKRGTSSREVLLVLINDI